LTAWSAAGVAGPLIVNGILDSREAAGAKGAALYTPSLIVMVCVLCVGMSRNTTVPLREIVTEGASTGGTEGV